MSLTVGELVATADLDDTGMLRGLATSEAGLHRLGAESVTTAELVHRSLEEAFSELPAVHLDVDSSDADREIAAVRARLDTLSNMEIGVDIETGDAIREVSELRARLTALDGWHPDVTVQAQVDHAVVGMDAVLAMVRTVDAADPTVDVHADTTAATVGLGHVAAVATAVGHMNPHVDVHVDDHGSSSFLSRRLSGLGSMLTSVGSTAASAMGSLASSVMLVGAGAPIVAGLVATLVNIAPAAAIGATALLSVVSAAAAIKIGTSGVSDALKAAFAPASGGGAAGGAAAGTNQVADAQRNLQRATQNAAYSNKQAAQQTAAAERDLASAQRSALAAQKAVNDARHQAVRDLQDMNNSLIDAQNASQDAENAVKDAAKSLQQAQVSGDPEQISRAQLAYNEAVQALREQQLQVQRLTVDTAAANKAGVEGSQTVTDAKATEADAVQTVRDKTLALSNAQEQQTRTVQQGVDAVLQAKEALTQAGAAGGGGGAGGVNAFAAAMAKLAPNARSFVREIMSLGPAWKALKLDVQQRLFAGLAGAVAATAAVGLPVLRKGLDDSAGALNRMGLGVLGAAKGLAADGTLGRALKGASTGLGNLSKVPGMVVTAFGQVAAAAAPQFEKLTKGLAAGAQTLSDKLTKAFKSGGMAAAIDHAVDLIKQIGSILGDVGSIIGSVMDAAQASGGGWLGVLKDISSALKTAFASPEVQAALSALFDTMAVLGKTVAPLVVQALGVIAPVLTALGPPAQVLIKALGDGLRPIIKALGPVLLAAAQAVGAIVVALSPLIGVVGDLIAQLLPILVPVLDLITGIFIDLAGPIKQIATVLGQALKPVIAGLTLVIQDLVDQYLAIFLDLLGEFLPLLPVLIPVFLQLGKSVGTILASLAPLLPQLATLAIIFMVQLLPAILPLIPPLLQLTTMLLILATDTITKIVVPSLQFLIRFMGGLHKAFQPAIDAVKWLTTGIASLFEWLRDHLVGHSVIPDMVRSIVAWFAGLPGKALNALGNIAGRLGGAISSAANRMVGAAKNGVASAVWWVGTLPSRAWNALGDLGGYLYNSGQALIRGFIDGIKSMLGSVGDAVSGVLGFAKDHFPNSPAKRGPFSGSGWTYHSGVATARDWVAGAVSQQDHVAAAMEILMGSAAGGLTSGAGSAVGNVGIASTGGGGSAPQTVRIIVDGPEAVKKLIRAIVTTDGRGSVQTAFGRG